MAKWVLEVRAEQWADSLHCGWRPAVAGTLNQTGLSDEAASTFSTKREAVEFARDLVWPENPDAVRVVGPEFTYTLESPE